MNGATFTLRFVVNGQVPARVRDVLSYNLNKDGSLNLRRTGLFGTVNGLGLSTIEWTETYTEVSNVRVEE